MAATVPNTNMRMYAMAAAFVGSASAGTITNSASGCSPNTMPVNSVCRLLVTLMPDGAVLLLLLLLLLEGGLCAAELDTPAPAKSLYLPEHSLLRSRHCSAFSDRKAG